MFFKDIIGQQEAKTRLINMVREGRVPHALMLTGKQGSGELPAAIAFAQYLLCSNQQANDSCGTCPSCQKVSKLAHPDLHLSFPIYLSKTEGIKSCDDLLADFRDSVLHQPYLNLNDWFNEIKSENKQPVIPAEESANILRKLSFTSYEGKYKIALIWLSEKMNAECANKLLKVLEEPSEKTIFILTSSAPEQLLPTILSRVQQIPFYSCTDEEIANGLRQRYNSTQEIAQQIALLANGNFGEAIALLQHQDENVSFLSNFQEFMRLALRFDAAKALDWIEVNAKIGREKQKQFIQYALEIFRDSLMFNFGDQSLVRISGQEKQFLEKFAPFINQKNYEQLVEEFNSNYYYIERNANPKILFMDLLLKTNELINKK
ncbi:MAG: DNA polymerase III subunit delta [Sphingobacteriaceae bacterium]|nr:DNA polymerase III subunit delta [Sphingobacteriaceae bacterium]